MDGYQELLRVKRLPLLDEATAAKLAEPLKAIAARHGITNLRFASEGRLLGHVTGAVGLMDTVKFQIEAAAELDAKFFLISDRVLGNRGVSPDLLTATPL
jgi:hypothetical protein